VLVKGVRPDEMKAVEPWPGHGSSLPELVSALYQGHYSSLCRTARLMVDDPGRAEELVQDAFTRTLSGNRVLLEPAATLGYIRRAVVHACHSELRRRRVERRIGVGSRSERLELDGSTRATGSGPSAARDKPFAEVVGERDAVVQGLRSLPPRQREAIVLRYYADLDEGAIADAMRCSVGTVKSQLFKARQRLSALLRPGGGEG
jgi:RNA polymerase sigma factor (sigma-70 family)